MAELRVVKEEVPLSRLLADMRRSMKPPRDEVREARALQQLYRTHARGKQRKVEAQKSFRLAAAAAVVLALGGGIKASFDLSRAEAPTQALMAPAESATEVSFADGSMAVLSQGASLHSEHQSEERVSVRQRQGKVSYRVRPNQHRAFEVHAGSILVRVIGTEFSVDLEGPTLEVEVTRGKVEVLDGERALRLGAGDRVALAVASTEAARLAQPSVAPSSVDQQKLAEDAAALEEAPSNAPENKGPSQDRGKVLPDRVKELLGHADQARRNGDLGLAAQVLREVVEKHSRDPRGVGALFTLGRVERARGRHAEAASAFSRVRERAPMGSLAEDALAEEALSWEQAGQGARARGLAQSYLERYPSGMHRERLGRLLRGK